VTILGMALVVILVGGLSALMFFGARHMRPRQPSLPRPGETAAEQAARLKRDAGVL
jgi:hypothetical protein